MDGIEGQGLERVFRQLGVDKTYIDGVKAPQEFIFNFSAGWYTKKAVITANNSL